MRKLGILQSRFLKCAILASAASLYAFAATLWAQDANSPTSGTDSLYVGAKSTEMFWLPGGLGALTVVLLILASVVLVLAIVRAIFPSSISATTFASYRETHADNLFFALQLQDTSAPGLPAVKGYLRSLGIRNATVIAQTRFPKNSRVQLLMGSLPRFPNAETTVAGRVTKVLDLGGSPKSYLISLRLDVHQESVRDPLLSYLRTLASRDRQAAL